MATQVMKSQNLWKVHMSHVSKNYESYQKNVTVIKIGGRKFVWFLSILNL